MGRLMNKKQATAILREELNKIDMVALETAIINYNHACAQAHTDDLCEMTLAAIRAAEDSLNILRRNINYHES